MMANRVPNRSALLSEVGRNLAFHQAHGVLIFQAPDDETAATLLLHLGAAGNVHTTTVRAFTAAEMDTILAKTHG